MSNLSMVNAAASVCVIIGALCGGYSTVLCYIDERSVLKATNKTICDRQDEMKAEMKANKDGMKAEINGVKAEINGLKTAVETSMHSRSRDILALSKSNQFQFTSFAGLPILVAIFAATRK